MKFGVPGPASGVICSYFVLDLDNPTGASSENDAYVTWNYREDWWSIGHSGIRLCGSEKGPLRNPLAVDAGGRIYRHEYGVDHEGAQPYAETGPFQIGEGDRVVQVSRLLPDEKVSGEVEARFFLRFAPNGPETAKGPYALRPETCVRFTAREFRLRLTGAPRKAWRVGHFRLDGEPGSRR